MLVICAIVELKLAEYQKLNSAARMGDLCYVDTNKDGVLDSQDRVYAGSGAPEVELGLNYGVNFHGFDLYMNWYASLGNEVINGTYIYTMQKMTNPDLVYQWSEAYPQSNIPTYRGETHDNYSSSADIWVEDGSFVRLKNMTLGYSFQQPVLAKLGLAKFRIYVTAENLWTITGYSGYDPEVGSDGLARRGLDFGTYPITRQFKGGVQITF